MSGKFKSLIWLILPASIALSGLAWNTHIHERSDYYFADGQKDTIPRKAKSYNIEQNGGIDEQIQQLEKAIHQLNLTLERKDWEKMERNLQESLSKIDLDKIQAEMEQSLQQIDAEKIKMEVERAINKANLKKMHQHLQLEMEKNSRNMNRQEMNREIENALRDARKEMEEVQKINYARIKQEMENTHKNISAEKLKIADELAKVRHELDMNKMNIEEELNKAKGEIKKTKNQMESYRKMIVEMDKDGLLKSKENYSIQYKNGLLYINGKEQPKQVLNKYKSYFPMDGVSLKRELDGHFEIRN